MAKILCVQLPKPNSEKVRGQQAKGMRDIRLLSLQTDPACFISRYEDEKDQPLQFSIDRLKNPMAEHFVAVATNCLDHHNAADTVRYEAFLVMLRSASEEKEQFSTSEYEMAAVYVRRESRGNGICTHLIREGLNWASTDSQAKNSKKVVVHATATEENVSAQRLYAKLGFKMVSQTVEKTKAGVELAVVNMELHM